MVESSKTDSDLQVLVAELQQQIRDAEYIVKCSKLIANRFEAKNWGPSELRKLEVTLEGSFNDDTSIDRVGDIFGHLEENPPTDRIKNACAENQHRAGGKLLDRSKYMPNPPLTDEMKEIARAFS